jgi:predicted nucleic acid-binding protein
MVEHSEPAVANPLRVMVDATVLFAGTRWPRWSYEVLRHALRGDIQLVLSPLVIKQARRNLVEKFPEYVESFAAWLALVSFEEVADPTGTAIVEDQTLMRDLKDVPIALSAIQGEVYCLVSEDKDFTAEDATTAELHRRLKVMRPVIFLREVMGWSKEDLEKVRSRDWPLGETLG